MSGFKLTMTKFWVNVLCPIWSFIINCFYWLFKLNKISAAKDKMNKLLALPLVNVMHQFKWRDDNFKDWYPWIITIVDKNLEDDCDGAAVLAKWWLKENSISSRLVFIYSSDGKDGHAVCVSIDNTILVSNREVIDLDFTNWRQDLFNKFDNKYSVIIEK
jgi:hypothetical protein